MYTYISSLLCRTQSQLNNLEIISYDIFGDLIILISSGDLFSSSPVIVLLLSTFLLFRTFFYGRLKVMAFSSISIYLEILCYIDLQWFTPATVSGQYIFGALLNTKWRRVFKISEILRSKFSQTIIIIHTGNYDSLSSLKPLQVKFIYIFLASRSVLFSTSYSTANYMLYVYVRNRKWMQRLRWVGNGTCFVVICSLALLFTRVIH